MWDKDYDKNILIRNIVFDGLQVEAKSEYTAGLYMCGVRKILVVNCVQKDIGGDGIYLGRGGRNRYCKKNASTIATLIIVGETQLILGSQSLCFLQRM